MFMNPKTEKPKLIECIRVDGASDEGPSHEEVMFWWTVHHIENEKLVTMVSARSSGASHLNRVELQNGCLALGHSNLFIPSTLCGSCVDSTTGNIDDEKLKANLDLATDIYISRTNGCPCGDTTIQLLKGADSTRYQNMRAKLQVFLKGSKKKKQELKRSEPDLFAYFGKVWDVRANHMRDGYPSQYLFVLKCCFHDVCPHPLCMKGPPEIDTWFANGPPLDYIPLPVPDPAQPWGNSTCQKCTGFCAGHFLDPEVAVSSSASVMKRPPSVIIKEFHTSLKGADPEEAEMETIATETMLPLAEVKMWLAHLTMVASNRKRGAAKAAQTRRKRNTTTEYFCEGQPPKRGQRDRSKSVPSSECVFPFTVYPK